MNINLGDKISTCRQNLNMTQEELASRLGVTPQAVSKWERSQSYPDIITFAGLCRTLNASADLLLETGCENLSETGDMTANREVRQNLRACQEPLALMFGEGLVDAFLSQPYAQHIEKQRVMLANEGILMPLLRVYDNFALKQNEFMVLSYHRVLYSEEIETVSGDTTQYIAEKTAAAIRRHYGYILNHDLIRKIVKNLEIEYPALISGVVPERISYSLLQKVLAGLLERGDGLSYMVKTIEVMEEELRRHPGAEAEELVHAVAKEIEREDNYYVLMAKRQSAPETD